jgi:glutamate dehydrogenase
VLENEGLLNRDLEFLPEDEELTERRNRGEGLTRPELSVLLSYSKIRLYQQLLASNVPEDPYLSAELVGYFPKALQDRYADYMHSHRLKREIIATQVTNSLINRMGASFTLRMHEDTGADPAEVAKAYGIARALFKARDFWTKVESLDNKVSADLQTSAMLVMWNLLRQTSRWLLNLPGRNLDIQAMIERLESGLNTLGASMQKSMSPEEKLEEEQRMLPYVEGGFPRALATRIALLPRLFPTLDVVETSARRKTDVQRVANVYFGLGESLALHWLRTRIESLEVAGQWHARARANLRDELFTQHNLLVEQILKDKQNDGDLVATWMKRNSEYVNQVVDMMQDMRNNSDMDYATIAVAVRSLAKLATETA